MNDKSLLHVVATCGLWSAWHTTTGPPGFPHISSFTRRRALSTARLVHNSLYLIYTVLSKPGGAPLRLTSTLSRCPMAAFAVCGPRAGSVTRPTLTGQKLSAVSRLQASHRRGLGAVFPQPARVCAKPGDGNQGNEGMEDGEESKRVQDTLEQIVQLQVGQERLKAKVIEATGTLEEAAEQVRFRHARDRHSVGRGRCWTLVCPQLLVLARLRRCYVGKRYTL